MEELCELGTMPKGHPSHANEYMWLFCACKYCIKDSLPRCIFRSKSHRWQACDDMNYHCYVWYLLHKCKEVNKINQQMYNNAFLFVISSEPVQYSEVKHVWGRVVLGWLTFLEVLVLHLFGFPKKKKEIRNSRACQLRFLAMNKT